MGVQGMNEVATMGKFHDQSDESFETLKARGPEYSLKIVSPKTIYCESGDYTTYGISLQTSSAAFRLSRSLTRRRFSDFVWLRKELNKIDNWRSPPSLTSRRFWNLFDPKFIETRRDQLEKWTNEVLSDPAYLSNTALHLFLQTEMSVGQMEEYLQGKVSEEDVEEIWHNHGKLYPYQAHNLLYHDVDQAAHHEPIVISFSPDEEKVQPCSQTPPIQGLTISLDHSTPASLSPPQGSCEHEGRSVTPYGSGSDLMAFGQDRISSPDSGFQDGGADASISSSSSENTTTTTTESDESGTSSAEASEDTATATPVKRVSFKSQSSCGEKYSINGD